VKLQGERKIINDLFGGKQATECEIARGIKMLSILFETIKGLLTNQWMVLWGKSERETHGSLPQNMQSCPAAFP
jgi:hypothetical protein